MSRPVQFFSDDYLDLCKTMKVDDIIKSIDNFQKMLIDPGELVQINIRVPKNILNLFKAKAKRSNIPYQQKIKELMKNWLL